MNQKIDSIEYIRKEDKKELHEGLVLVKKQLDYIKNVMLNTSIEVMDYLTVMHDLEKQLQEIEEMIPATNVSDELKSLIYETHELVNKENNLLRDKSKKKYNLNELLSDIIYSKRYKFRRNNVEVIEDYTETEGIIIKINKSSLVRILDNLINNSLYWKIGNNDKIKIYTKKIKEHVEIIFDDNGCGFRGDPEFLKEPFVTNKIDDEGLGLGLFIVGELMKSQNGSFEISNGSSIGQGGAQVKLIFPLEVVND